MQACWIAAVAFAVIAVIAALAERRRARRVTLDRVGWVPWSAILLTALFAGAICITLALRG